MELGSFFFYFTSAHIDCPSLVFTICRGYFISWLLIHYLFVYPSQSVLAFDVIWVLFPNSLSSLSSYFPPCSLSRRSVYALENSFHWVYISFYCSFSKCFIMWSEKRTKPKLNYQSLKLSDSSWSLSLYPPTLHSLCQARQFIQYVSVHVLQHAYR